MRDFQIGEIVRLGEFPLVRVADTSELGVSELGVVLDCELGTFPLTIPLGVVEVIRVAADHWPPQAGDLWRDRHGELWFATDVHDVEETDEPDVRLVSAFEGGTPWLVGRAVSPFGPFTLVHRDDHEIGERRQALAARVQAVADAQQDAADRADDLDGDR